MAIKIRKIKNQGKRTMSYVASGFDKKKKPEKALTFGKTSKVGRMRTGKISIRQLNKGLPSLSQVFAVGKCLFVS